MSNVQVSLPTAQDVTDSRLQDIEKPTGSSDTIITVSSDGIAVTTPVVDGLIRKLGIATFDMRSYKSTGNNVNVRNSKSKLTSGTVKSNHKEPNCDNLNETVRGNLIADKYQLFEQVIGSSLYRCVDVESKQELVCKIVSKDNRSILSAHYRLDSEPLIQSLHEVVVGQRYLYLVFPKAHGDLHTYIRQRKRLRESEARKLFKQIAETVQLCHQNGIVLRDLKLRKFVFADVEQTQLKLESFEDAVVMKDPDCDWLHDKRGCPAYVSPEILNPGPYSGKGADMWSLGVILYTMLVGRYPFTDSDHSKLFARIADGNYLIPDCISCRASDLIRSLLRRQPAERISSDDILYHPWLAKKDREWVSRSCDDQLVPDGSLYDD